MIPNAVNRSPGICLEAEENPGKPQLRVSLGCETSQAREMMGKGVVVTW